MATTIGNWPALLALALPAVAAAAACSSTSKEPPSTTCTGSSCATLPANAVVAPPQLALAGVAHATVEGAAQSGKIVLFAADRSTLQRIDYTSDVTGRRVRAVGKQHTYDIEMRRNTVRIVLDGGEVVVATADEASRSWTLDDRGRELLKRAEAEISTVMNAVEALAPQPAGRPKLSAEDCGGDGASCVWGSDCCSGSCLASGECGSGGGGSSSSSTGGASSNGGGGGGISCGSFPPSGYPGTLTAGTTMAGYSFFSGNKLNGCNQAQADVNQKCKNNWCADGCYPGSINQNWCSCNCLVGDTICPTCTIEGSACACTPPQSPGSSSGGGSTSSSTGGSSSGGWCTSTGNPCDNSTDCCSNNCYFGTCS